MTSKLVVNTIEADTGISSVSFASSISMSSTSKFHFGDAGIDIGADTNINRPAAGVIGFNINSSERARINSSGRLGLGTNNPDTTLTVQSGGDAQMSLKNSSGTTKAYVGTAGAFGSAGTDDLRIRSDSSNIVFGFSGAERLRIKSDGKVGIGTINPSVLLDVQGHAGSGAQTTIRSKSTAANASNFVRSESSDGLYIGLLKYGTGHSAYGALPAGGGAVYANSSVPITIMSDGGSGYINFATGGNTERLRIHSDGRISVGTNTFIDGSTKLEISGKLANTSAGGQNIHKYGSASAFHYGQYNSTGDASLNNQANAILTFATNNTERVRISSNGQLQISPAGAVKMSFYHDSGGSINHITSNNGNEIKVSSGNGDSNGIEFWDYTGTNKRCQIDGHGIKFNTDTAEANALDDYEEGTYVPSTNTGLTLNSGYNTLSYIKIGRCCTVRGLFFPNNNPSGGHTMSISLPFASYNYTGSGASIAGAGGSGAMYRSISGADAGVAVYVNDNVSTALFYKNGSNGGAWSPVYNNDWNSGMEIYVDFTYFTV